MVAVAMAVVVMVVMVVMVAALALVQRGGGGALVVGQGVALEAEAGLGLEGPAEGAVERGGAAHDAQDRVFVQLQQVARLPAHHVRRAAEICGRAAVSGGQW